MELLDRIGIRRIRAGVARRVGWRVAGAMMAGITTALVLGIGGGHAGGGPMAGSQSGPSLISIAFGPQEIWQPSREANIALHTCSGQTVSCVQPVMEQDGATPDAIAFFRLTGWFLTDIQDTGVVQLGTVLNPWRANENYQPALLGGTPAVVLLEREIALTNMAGTVERNPDFMALAAENPRALFWGSGPAFEGMDTSPEGGPRFIFDYHVLDGCHACAILADARIAFDFAPDGTFEGPHLLNVVPR
jgi:hypothetical protein